MGTTIYSNIGSNGKNYRVALVDTWLYEDLAPDTPMDLFLDNPQPGDQIIFRDMYDGQIYPTQTFEFDGNEWYDPYEGGGGGEAETIIVQLSNRKTSSIVVSIPYVDSRNGYMASCVFMPPSSSATLKAIVSESVGAYGAVIETSSTHYALGGSVEETIPTPNTPEGYTCLLATGDCTVTFTA